MPRLRERLGHSAERARLASAEALGAIGPPSRQVLDEPRAAASAETSDPSVREAAQRAIERIEGR